jgi:Oxoglutarate and iron-dependent oxygenase degradation C-term
VAADVSSGTSHLTTAAAADSSTTAASAPDSTASASTTASTTAAASSDTASSANDKANGKVGVKGKSQSTVEIDETGPGGAQDASAVYKADDAGSLLSVSASFNALSLVLRDDANVLSFIKYVSSAAPGSRYDIAAEYVVDASGDGSDSEADEPADAVTAAGAAASSSAGSSSLSAAPAAAAEPSSKRSKLNPT